MTDDTAREALAKELFRVRARPALEWEHASEALQDGYRAQADAILAILPIDAIVAERVAELHAEVERLRAEGRDLARDNLDLLGRVKAAEAPLAERVAALAEDKALITRLYRESRGSRSLGDIHMVLRALAAALRERRTC